MTLGGGNLLFETMITEPLSVIREILVTTAFAVMIIHQIPLPPTPLRGKNGWCIRFPLYLSLFRVTLNVVILNDLFIFAHDH